ncbi:tripartite tricarboxylate transporter TctB family protein [Noviherbaspirillum sedimenti]|uniref:Tripartite tricarboxylate transporter TctB family protein n=1 Tax=Noviherbaspirillum sedimenti TaxID=2320865 RepID=A0A3A3G6G0_9BURK|nr:tripartite tricarboxylate transporter TctB family protein [Noviherbaspirillum sedimenti]RJG03245.1 tripartite tricarboxylate transporter TctB family protein [Noviherbaspirillum sedimenti]
MLISNQKDFFAGLMFTVVGGAFALGAREYSIGTSASMGPGYFPLMLGILLAALGIALALQSFGEPDEDEKVGAIAWQPLFFITIANLAFGILLGGLPLIGLPSMGLVLAIIALVLLASLAGEEFKLREALVLAGVLALGSWLVFIKLINLPIQLWPAFFTA